MNSGIGYKCVYCNKSFVYRLAWYYKLGEIRPTDCTLPSGRRGYSYYFCSHECRDKFKEKKYCCCTIL